MVTFLQNTTENEASECIMSDSHRSGAQQNETQLAALWLLRNT